MCARCEARSAVTVTATFTQTGTDVMLVVSLMNCPGGLHGVRIHEGTSCADATMQGAHWGPTRGEGIPNVMCTEMTGTAIITRTAADAMLAWSIGGDVASDIVGHPFVVHDPAPDATTPAPRVGCGVITAQQSLPRDPGRARAPSPVTPRAA